MEKVQKWIWYKTRGYIDVVVIPGNSLLIEFDVQVTVRRDKFV